MQHKRIKFCYLLLLSSGLVFSSCQKPRIIFEEAANNTLIFTEGINYERQNFIARDVQIPLNIDKTESLNGQTTTQLGLVEDHLILTTRNGYLSVLKASNLGKNRKIRLSKGTSASPTMVNGGKLFIPMETGNYGLRVYDLQKTEILWDLEGYLSKSSPVIINDLVVHAAKDGRIAAFNCNNGKKIWETEIGSQIHSNLASHNHNLIVASQDGLIINFDPGSGLVLWSEKIDEALPAQPLILNNTAYFLSFNGNCYKVNLKNGGIKLLHPFKVKNYLPLSTDGKFIYIALSDGRIAAMDYETEEIRWITNLEGPAAVPILVTNAYLLIGTSQKYLYVLEKKSGNILYSLKLEKRISSLPIIYGNSVILGLGYDKIARLIPGVEENKANDEK